MSGIMDFFEFLMTPFTSIFGLLKLMFVFIWNYGVLIYKKCVWQYYTWGKAPFPVLPEVVMKEILKNLNCTDIRSAASVNRYWYKNYKANIRNLEAYPVRILTIAFPDPLQPSFVVEPLEPNVIQVPAFDEMELMTVDRLLGYAPASLYIRGQKTHPNTIDAMVKSLPDKWKNRLMEIGLIHDVDNIIRCGKLFPSIKMRMNNIRGTLTNENVKQIVTGAQYHFSCCIIGDYIEGAFNMNQEIYDLLVKPTNQCKDEILYKDLSEFMTNMCDEKQQICVMVINNLFKHKHEFLNRLSFTCESFSTNFTHPSLYSFRSPMGTIFHMIVLSFRDRNWTTDYFLTRSFNLSEKEKQFYAKEYARLALQGIY